MVESNESNGELPYDDSGTSKDGDLGDTAVRAARDSRCAD
jgi:hypothetical protein